MLTATPGPGNRCDPNHTAAHVATLMAFLEVKGLARLFREGMCVFYVGLFKSDTSAIGADGEIMCSF